MLAIKEYMQQDSVKQKFEELLGNNAGAYLTSVLSAISANEMLQKADPKTVYMATIKAASMRLAIDPNLGFAYIVPYNNTKTGTVEAQFQMGYKGFIQLAQRSGTFKTINAVPVYEGDTDKDVQTRLTSIITPDPKSDIIIGYVGYFKLLNGFEKHLYMSEKSLKEHGAKFSKSFKKGYGLWKDDFNAMAIKTVLKLLISKYGPLSIDLQTAIQTDQAVIRDEDDIEYVDNQAEIIEAENNLTPALVEHWVNGLNECKTLEELKEYKKQNKPTDPAILDLFKKREDELK